MDPNLMFKKKSDMENDIIFFSTEKNRLSRYSSPINITLTILVLLIGITNIWCQTKEIGIIDFYGPRSNDMELRSCLPFRENDALQLDTISSFESFFQYKEAILDCFKLTQPNIKQVDLAFICCVDQGGKWIIYVGVDTALMQIPEHNKTKDIKLPIEITRVYDSLMNLIVVAIQHGEADEDDTNGHSLITYLPARKLQEKFIKYADSNLGLLREVLNTSKYNDQRAVAATVIGYYDNKAEIIKDLIEAVTDSDNEVRNNATRAIGIIAEYAQSRPNLKIEIPADPFIKMMNSIIWTDRNKGVSILRVLSSTRDQKLLLKLKKEALESLIDMAKWQSEGHSHSGYLILGRIAGWTEAVLMDEDSFRKNKSEMMKKMLTAIK